MDVIENEHIKFWFENEILMSKFKNPINFNKDLIVEIVKLRHLISNSNYQIWCMDCSNVLSMSTEARNYASIFGQDLLYGCAVIINSRLGMVLYNSYTKFYPPKIPFVLFTKKENAVQWLLDLKKKIEHHK